MQMQTQFSVYLINKPGVLAAVTGALAKAKVNITALALMDAGEHGALRMVCDDPDKTRKVLGKTHDRWTEAEVLTLELDNHPGSFATIARKFAAGHVNITYAYCSSGAGGGKTTGVFKVSDARKARKVLAPARKTARKDAGTTRKPPPTRRR